MRLDLVYNPVAGSFRQGRLDALIAAFAARGATVTALPTTRDGAQLSGSADLVCVHGGDGTLRDTVQALGARAGEVPLCIAPAGTINLVARELSVERVEQTGGVGVVLARFVPAFQGLECAPEPVVRSRLRQWPVRRRPRW